ncbi:MAG: hypothetical protein R6U56_04480 [Opitutales bacterium]
MQPITIDRLKSLQDDLPPLSAEDSPDQEIEPILQNGMSDEYRAFLKDDAEIDRVLSETLALLD